MKKLTIILASLLFSTGAFAQCDFLYGVKAGMNVATLTHMKGMGELPGMYMFMMSDREAQIGYYAGVFAEYRFNNYVGLQLEALYSRQGARWRMIQYDGSKMINNIKIDYINIPLMVKIYPVKKFSIDFGPQVGFVVRARLKMKQEAPGDFGPVDMEQSADLPKDIYKKIDLSFGVGMSYEITHMLEASARYNFGLTKVITEKVNDGKYPKNGVFQVGLGLKF